MKWQFLFRRKRSKKDINDHQENQKNRQLVSSYNPYDHDYVNQLTFQTYKNPAAYLNRSPQDSNSPVPSANRTKQISRSSREYLHEGELLSSDEFCPSLNLDIDRSDIAETLKSGSIKRKGVHNRPSLIYDTPPIYSVPVGFCPNCHTVVQPIPKIQRQDQASNSSQILKQILRSKAFEVNNSVKSRKRPRLTEINKNIPVYEHNAGVTRHHDDFMWSKQETPIPKVSKSLAQQQQFTSMSDSGIFDQDPSTSSPPSRMTMLPVSPSPLLPPPFEESDFENGMVDVSKDYNAIKMSPIISHRKIHSFSHKIRNDRTKDLSSSDSDSEMGDALASSQIRRKRRRRRRKTPTTVTQSKPLESTINRRHETKTSSTNLFHLNENILPPYLPPFSSQFPSVSSNASLSRQHKSNEQKARQPSWLNRHAIQMSNRGLQMAFNGSGRLNDYRNHSEYSIDNPLDGGSALASYHEEEIMIKPSISDPTASFRRFQVIPKYTEKSDQLSEFAAQSEATIRSVEDIRVGLKEKIEKLCRDKEELEAKFSAVHQRQERQAVEQKKLSREVDEYKKEMVLRGLSAAHQKLDSQLDRLQSSYDSLLGLKMAKMYESYHSEDSVNAGDHT